MHPAKSLALQLIHPLPKTRSLLTRGCRCVIPFMKTFGWLHRLARPEKSRVFERGSPYLLVRNSRSEAETANPQGWSDRRERQTGRATSLENPRPHQSDKPLPPLRPPFSDPILAGTRSPPASTALGGAAIYSAVSNPWKRWGESLSKTLDFSGRASRRPHLPKSFAQRMNEIYEWGKDKAFETIVLPSIILQKSFRTGFCAPILVIFLPPAIARGTSEENRGKIYGAVFLI